MNPYIQYMYSYPHKTAYRSLSGVSLKDYAPLLKGSGHGLYLHIPFCQAKCGYCNLFSVTGQKEEKIERYLDTVERQSQQYQSLLAPYQTEFSELVIGGGTPLLLSEWQLLRMFALLEKYFTFQKGRELIIETAPNQTDAKRLSILKQAKVTRVSMGIQSFSDQELRVLGRQHSAQRAREALALLKSYHFPCINVDFIYGIPGQSTEGLLASLKEALTYKPDEIFLYPLYIRDGVRMQRQLFEGKEMVLEPEAALIQYREARDYLCAEGYRQDSMRRFVKGRAKRGYTECGMGTSLALGCGGRSYLGNLHFCTPYGVTQKDCLRQLEDYEHTIDFGKITHGICLTSEELSRRWVIRHLLIRPGLEMKRYQEQFGRQAEEDFPILMQWKEEKYLKEVLEGTRRYLTLTEKGMELSDYLGPQLISAKVDKLMKEWGAVYERTDTSISGQSKKL